MNESSEPRENVFLLLVQLCVLEYYSCNYKYKPQLNLDGISALAFGHLLHQGIPRRSLPIRIRPLPKRVYPKGSLNI
jgi:hypothetical protein